MLGTESVGTDFAIAAHSIVKSGTMVGTLAYESQSAVIFLRGHGVV
jgi:hypothetical protein